MAAQIYPGHRQLRFHEATGLITDYDGNRLGGLQFEQPSGWRRAGQLFVGLQRRRPAWGKAYDATLLDASDSVALLLKIKHGELAASDPAGDPIGVVTRGAGTVREGLNVRISGPWRKKAIISLEGTQLAKCDGPAIVPYQENQPFEWAITDPDGAAVAKISHEGRVNQLEFQNDAGEPLRTMLIALAAGMFNRYWLER